ncbi:MAG: hypothetical protein FJZ58_01740 [Chlamydiae bacterium]|nr:hypothetical protein [Chlamydiota bacterium]
MTTSWLVCNALIEKRAKGQTKAFASFLPPSQQKKLLSLPAPHEDLSIGFQQEDLLHRIHVSWFAKWLRSLPKQKATLFLPLFSQEQCTQLQEILLFHELIPTLSHQAKLFLQQELLGELLKGIPDLLPTQALPSSDLLCLLSLSAKELQILVDFLGLRDLAVELTQIIDKTRLQQIHSLLSQEQRLFLHSLVQKKEPLMFKKMDLAKGSLHKESLLSELHKRGMNRLAKALYPAHEHLVWYVTHQMPENEAVLLVSLRKPLDNPKAYTILTKQVMELVQYLPKSSTRAAP